MKKMDLFKVAQEKGLSAREARKFVNAVFNTMIRGLWRGEEVEIPGGTIQKVSNDRPVIHRWLRSEPRNGKVYFRVRTYNKRRKEIKFRLDPHFRWDQE